MDDRSAETAANETLPDVGLRELAHVLVRGDAEADDFAQDAWIVHARKNALALEARSPLAFGILRNLARSRDRRERQRRSVERGSARSESVEPAHADLERREIERRLVACVRALDEPYRPVVALRYLEEHTAEEVARRLDRPAATVRSQTLRGLALLRERLDREDPGGHMAWCASLSLLDVGRARPRGRSFAVRPWMIAGAAIVGLAFVAQRFLGTGVRVESPPTAAANRVIHTPGPLQPANDGGARQPIGGVEAFVVSEAGARVAFDSVPLTPIEFVDVLTVEANGRPPANVDVFVVAAGVARHASRSSASGRLQFPFTQDDLASEIAVLAPAQLALVAEDQERSTSLLVRVERRRALADVVRIPLDRGGVILAGTVLDPAGIPIAGAIVEYGETVVRRIELEPGVVRHDASAPERSDDAGHFTMRVDPGRAWLRARASGLPETMFAVIVERTSSHACTLRFSRGTTSPAPSSPHRASRPRALECSSIPVRLGSGTKSRPTRPVVSACAMSRSARASCGRSTARSRRRWSSMSARLRRRSGARDSRSAPRSACDSSTRPGHRARDSRCPCAPWGPCAIGSAVCARTTTGAPRWSTCPKDRSRSSSHRCSEPFLNRGSYDASRASARTNSSSCWPPRT